MGTKVISGSEKKIMNMLEECRIRVKESKIAQQAFGDLISGTIPVLGLLERGNAPALVG